MANFSRFLFIFFIVLVLNSFYHYESLSNQIKNSFDVKKYFNKVFKNQINQSNGQFFDYQYRERMVEYLKKWKNGLEKGIPALKIYPTLLDETHELLLMEHRIYPLSNTKRKIPLSATLNCRNRAFSSFLTLENRSEIIKIIDLIPFTYEFSILEMRLYELYDVVDEFVIFESNLTQRKIYKPLFLTQNIHKFDRFIDKITLMTPFNITKFNKNGTINQVITIRDEDILSEYKTSERIPIDMREGNEQGFNTADNSFEYKFRESIFTLYSKYVREFDENDDLLIHGDLDEIPSSNIVQHFKYCQVKDDLYPFSFWSTFYVYKFKYLFQSDFPAFDDRFSLTFPNIFRYKDKIHINKIRIVSGTLLPKASGAHCNRFGGFITDLYKAVSISDGSGFNEQHFRFMKNASLEGVIEIKKTFDDGKIYPSLANRVYPVVSIEQKSNLFLPWIVPVNKECYKRFLD